MQIEAKLKIIQKAAFTRFRFICGFGFLLLFFFFYKFSEAFVENKQNIAQNMWFLIMRKVLNQYKQLCIFTTRFQNLD